MKKNYKYLFSQIGLLSLAPTIFNVTSCGQTTVSKKRIKDDDTVVKEKSSLKGSFVCDWTLTLTNELEDGQSLQATITKVESSQGTETISFKSRPVVTEKKINFSTILTPSSSNCVLNAETLYWIKFNITFVCKDSESKEVWTQTLSDFKHTSKIEIKEFFISPISNVDDVEVTSTAISIDSSDTFTIAVNNKRTNSIVSDASLIIRAGGEKIVIGQPTINAGVTNIYENINKDYIARLFTAEGKTFPTQGTIEFHLARVGAYFVKSNYRLGKINENGEEVNVSDSEIDNFSDGTFLVKDLGSNDLILSTESFSTFIDTHSATNNYDLYFIKGEFFSGSKSAATSAAPVYRLHGILKSSGSKPASLRVYLTQEEGGQAYHGLHIDGIRFEMDNLRILGRDGIVDYSIFNDQSQGLWTTEGTSFTDCDFIGSYCTCYSHSDFIRCTFDSTNTKKASGQYFKNNYPMYFYGKSTGSFEDCTFTSGGKAVKIYYEPNTTGTYEFEFKNCKFNLSETHTNYIEYPVDIDAAEQTSNELQFKLSFDNDCQVNQSWLDCLHNEYKQIWHVKDNADESGKAIHVKINDESVVPFEWDPQPITA